MKPIYTILLVFQLVAVNGFTQVTIKVLNQLDSSAIVDVVCADEKTNGVLFTNDKGVLQLKKNTYYILTHPSFYSLKTGKILSDTTVYLQPLVRDIEEVEIVSMSNENLFNAVIKKYRTDLANSNRKGTLYYKNTNWFEYQYKEQQKTDSAFCVVENTLNFEYTEAQKKSKIVFLPVTLNRYCSTFYMPENTDIKTSELPAFSKFDFSLFLNALFTKRSFFDEIGFEQTSTNKKEDKINQTIELKFLSDECEKTLILSIIDSSLLSYQFRFISKLGSYHVYYATFIKNEIQTLYEEKGYLFKYELQNHLFYSIHFGRFTTGIDNVDLNGLIPFSDIIKSQLKEDLVNGLSSLYPIYKYFLNPKK